MATMATCIAETTAAANAVLNINANTVVVATKLGLNERVIFKIYGVGGDVEQVMNKRKTIILTRDNNSEQLAGPCIYHVYKSITVEEAGVGYYV